MFAGPDRLRNPHCYGERLMSTGSTSPAAPVVSSIQYPVLAKKVVKTVEHVHEASGRKFDKFKGTKKEKPTNAVQCVVDGTLGWYVPAGTNGAAPAAAATANATPAAGTL
jgi:hypothetical protein